jgi:hypothetical protein
LAAPFEKLGGKPLIRIVERPSRHGGKPYHEITAVNIWGDNDQYFSRCQSPPTSGRELASSANEVATSPIETKKTLKRKINEEEPPSLSPSLREMKGEARSELSEFWNFLCRIFQRTDHRGPTKTEARYMLRLLPVRDEEYRLVEWWMTLDTRRRDFRVGVGFYLWRRPRSVTSLLKNWSSTNDIARQYWKQYEDRGYVF